MMEIVTENWTGEFLKNAVLYAIKKEMEKHEEKDNECDGIMFETLRRSKAVMERLNIWGLKILSMSNEEFLKYINDRPNIIFLTDAEKEEMDNALRIYRAIENAALYNTHNFAKGYSNNDICAGCFGAAGGDCDGCSRKDGKRKRHQAAGRHA